jgi:hypothetical protein
MDRPAQRGRKRKPRPAADAEIDIAKNRDFDLEARKVRDWSPGIRKRPGESTDGRRGTGSFEQRGALAAAGVQRGCSSGWRLPDPECWNRVAAS